MASEHSNPHVAEIKERRFTRARIAALLVLVALLVTSGAFATLRVLPPSVSPPRATITSPKYLVLMVLDGARPGYLGIGSLPHVAALRARGIEYTNAVAGILEAETPSGHATIASGSRPDHNGILGFDWVNDNDRYSLFSPDRMVNLVQILHDSHAPTIAGLYKQKFPGSRVVALSGHKYYAAAPLGGPDADAIMYFQGDAKGRYVPVAVPGHMPPAGVLDDPSLVYPTTHTKDGVEDSLATNLALVSVQKMQPRILMINYPEFDWPLGHVDGGSVAPTKVAVDMQAFDADLGRIEHAYRAAGILKQTLFVITADHGMMPIRRFVSPTIVTDAITKAGTTAPNIASSTTDYVWLTDRTKAQTVAENIINAHDAGVDSAYYLTTAGGTLAYVAAGTVGSTTEAANQYLLRALMNGHEPTVVVFGREGASFSDPKTGWKADHGGQTWQSQHIPLVIAGPGIQHGKVSTMPAQLEDVAPTVLKDMGVEPTGMQGRVLAEALQEAPPTLQRARTVEVVHMSPLLRSLIAADRTALGVR